jgi:hypothetical protein
MTETGRYGLHFHHCYDATRGSLVEGVVGWGLGSHAFVPHQSHGITFRDCISHDTFLDAYWWDFREDSHDTLYERCVASLVKFEPDFRGWTLAGFSLDQGIGNAAIGCVAVGVRGNGSAAGFKWPEVAQGSPAVWEFRDCVGHNNRVNGIFTWQNTEQDHVIDRFVGYYNGHAGIDHGAYFNKYRYKRSHLYGNAWTGVLQHGASITEGPCTFEDLIIDGAGIADHGFIGWHHNGFNATPTRILRCQMRNHRKASMAWLARGGEPTRMDVVDCSLGEWPFWIVDGSPADGRIRVQTETEAFLLRPSGQPGTPVAAWNATRTDIPRFA